MLYMAWHRGRLPADLAGSLPSANLAKNGVGGGLPLIIEGTYQKVYSLYRNRKWTEVGQDPFLWRVLANRV